MQRVRLPRWPQATLSALEQRKAHARFEIGQQTTHRRLRHTQRVSGTRDRARNHQGAKRFNLANTEFGTGHNINAWALGKRHQYSFK
jgi:hypothetical protein